MRLALFFLLLSLVGCTDYPNEKVIQFGLSAAPMTLDPRYATDAESYRIIRLIYRSLVDFDQAFNMIPGLAHWEQHSLRHYRFILGDTGRRFHNNSRLTASDVKATYTAVLTGEPISPHQYALHMIDEIIVVDEDTIDFLLKFDDALFPGRLTTGILPADLIAQAHPFNKEPIGSNAIAFSSWPNESEINLLRLTDQQKIQFTVVADPTVRILKLLREELDLIQNNIPAEMLHWIKTQKKAINIMQKPGNTFAYIGFNMDDPITGDRNIRAAIAHAIDRDAIITHLLRDTATHAETLLAQNHWARHSTLNPYPYDPERAKAYIKAAGFDLKKPIKISYKSSNNPSRLRLATILQAQLSQVGFAMEIQSYDWGMFYDDIKKGRFQMYGLAWTGIKTPDIFRYAFHSDALPPKGANRGRLQDETVDALITAAEKASDITQKAHHYRALQLYLHQLLPFIPLWHEDQVLLARPVISGYQLHIDGYYDSLLRTKKTNDGATY